MDVIVGIETPRGLCTQAREFLEAARRATDGKGVPDLLFPFYYLIGHTIELALKAALLHDGIPAKTLRSPKFGHDLKALREEFIRRNLHKLVPLTIVDCGLIDLVNYDYDAKRFEYRQAEHSYQLPLPNMIDRVASRIVDGVEQMLGDGGR